MLPVTVLPSNGCTPDIDKCITGMRLYGKSLTDIAVCLTGG